MNPASSVIHFNCLSCGSLLTVPAEMAGVTGPCPMCGASITSPAPPPPTQVNPFAPPNQPLMGAAALPAAPAQSYPQPSALAWQQAGSPTPLPAPPQPTAGAWQQEGSPAPLPAAPAGGMAGATWPPSGSVARGTGAHPVMDRLLHTQPAVHAAVPPYQERSGSPPRQQRMSSTRETGKRGAMLLAVCMAVLVLLGTSWFFRDQLRAAWLSYTLKDDETPPESPTVSPTKGPGEAPLSDATASVLPKAIPVAPTFLTGPETPAVTPTSPENSPPVTILPALPARPPASAPPAGSLVEVPRPPTAGPPVNVVPLSPPSVPALVTGMTPESQPALEALQKFFQAKTWGDRLPFVQAPASMKPLMEKYYAENPDGPLPASHIQMIRHDKAPETGPPLCVFQVSGGGLKQPLPIMVEVTDLGWKVDWLTFTEFKDELLLKFLEAPQAEPARFHVLMRRAHYFGDDVPSLDKKTCFQVMPPMPGFTGDVFALKGTNVARDLDKFLGWDVNQAAAVVELQWRKDENYKWVELTNLVQLNWRNVEPGGKSAAGAGAAETMPPKAQAVP